MPTSIFSFVPTFVSVLILVLALVLAILIAIEMVKAIVIVIDLGTVNDMEIAVVVLRVAESSGIVRGLFALEWGFTSRRVRGAPAGGGFMPSIFIGR